MATPTLPITQLSDADFINEIGKLIDQKNLAFQQKNADALKKIEDDTKALVTQFAEQKASVETELRTLKQRSSRPPGAGPAEYHGRSLGQQFTESEAFKTANFTGRFKIGSSIKSRLGVEVKAAPPITEGTSGLVIYPRRVAWVQPPEFPLVMRDLLDVVPLEGTNAVEYVIETWQNNADYQVAEGDRKAQSGVTYTDATAVVRTIAHFVKVSRQMLADVPFVQTTIDQRLVYYVLLKEDKEVLYGDGTAGHLHGIMPQATPYVAPPAIATSVTTGMDAILAAITQVALAGYRPNAIVVSPVDWAGIQLAKTTFGTYILQGPGYGPPQALSVPSLWGLPVLADINVVPGDFLVGMFPGNAALFDRETAVVEISFENEDDFVRNLATIRCEERVTLAVYVPAAFVKGTIAAPFGFSSSGAPAAAPSGMVPPAPAPTTHNKVK